VENKIQSFESINPYLVFLFFIFLSPFSNYITGSGKITYLPIIIAGLYVVAYEIWSFKREDKKPIIEALLFLPFTILSLFAYYGHPFEEKALNYITFNLSLLPVLALTAIRVFRYKQDSLEINIQTITNIIIAFAIGQLIICIGQFFTYTFGYGFPIVEEYRHRNFISGTFYNPNNMSASILLLSFILLGLKKHLTIVQLRSSLIVFSLVLLFGGSRSAIILFIAITIINLRPRPIKIAKYILLLFASIIFIYTLSTFVDNSALDRIIDRLHSFINILHRGISSDGSISARGSSYLHFLGQLPGIALGTHKLYDYHSYAGSASFQEMELLFSYPHSFIVEI